MNGMQVYSGGTTHKIQRSRVENWQTALWESGGKLSKAGSFADMAVRHAFRTVIWTDELTKQCDACDTGRTRNKPNQSKKKPNFQFCFIKCEKGHQTCRHKPMKIETITLDHFPPPLWGARNPPKKGLQQWHDDSLTGHKLPCGSKIDQCLRSSDPRTLPPLRVQMMFGAFGINRFQLLAV